MANNICLAAVIIIFLVGNVEPRHRPRKQQSTCDDICCPLDKICQMTATGRARCTKAMSCEELQCPQGFICVNSTKPKTPKMTPKKSNSVKCQIDCSQVACPSFLECKAKGRNRHSAYAECKQPKNCPVECPDNTTCTMLRGRRGKSFCIADSCENVDCGDSAECTEGEVRINTKGPNRGLPKRISSFDSFLRAINKIFDKKPKSKSKSKGPGKNQLANLATCIPKCTDVTCPVGLVCEEKKSKLRCRLPRNCDELSCPAGQQCQVKSCSKSGRVKSKSKYNIAECVDIVATSVAMPAPSSTAPEPSSASPESSSPAPEPSSAAPEPSSTAPESSSAAPESSSAAPEPSSAAPNPSPDSPVSSAAPDENFATISVQPSPNDELN